MHNTSNSGTSLQLMDKSGGSTHSVHCKDIVRSSEGPLKETRTHEPDRPSIALLKPYDALSHEHDVLPVSYSVGA